MPKLPYTGLLLKSFWLVSIYLLLAKLASVPELKSHVSLPSLKDLLPLHSCARLSSLAQPVFADICLLLVFLELMSALPKHLLGMKIGFRIAFMYI